MGSSTRGGAAKKPAARKPAARKRAAKKPPAPPLAPRQVVTQFPMRVKRPVAAFLGLELDDPALTAVLSVQASTGLSVFNGELFAIEDIVPSRDAAGVVGEKWVRRPAAGRDGFLAVAERSGVFGGIVGDVVCANDTFDVDWSRADAPLVVHRHAALTGGGTAAEAAEYRGPIIGAWAKGWRVDRGQPFFYFAPLKQHGRTFASPGSSEMTWIGAWEYTNAMILKCAMSYVLRILFVITGVLPADELKNDPTLAREVPRAGDAPRQIDVSQVLAIPDAIPAGSHHARLVAAVGEANRLASGAWTAAKCEMTFAGRSDEELARLADTIEKGNASGRAVEERRAMMPDRADDADGPVSDEELRSRLALARSRAGAARKEGEHAAAAAEVVSLEAALAARAQPTDPPAS